ncbi:MAG: hypothetical protein GKR89_05015 [Candidatus Latescibacteria bacterium]|nr:hypothetical protein [Candidatus Latescibacterota bacterium]
MGQTLYIQDPLSPEQFNALFGSTPLVLEYGPIDSFFAVELGQLESLETVPGELLTSFWV